ncbi:hypothetical protein FRB94_010877 [Tulasnella sp. JGI-2019a]|nr:hypothetical protein FRB93_009704 [Tulasnella sp. JGI-2019a]KAG9010180.1 hypothetical protein FRB94_010877 [Tulasnella sp. JGI-2019a]KAG9029966.1 hypothetical protein FRB95_004669 [Tulasnella sp. JGI-2019a]
MLSLPTEILQVVACQLSQSDLKVLSTTSHNLRDALLPMVLKEMKVGSIEKLRELSSSHQNVLGLVRHLDVNLSLEFFDSWTHDSGSSIASVISRTQHIQSLAFNASNEPYTNPWNRLSIADTNCRGLSLGVESSDTVLPVFDRLTHLDLQTISAGSIETLLSRAPHLLSLSITLPDGLSEFEMSCVLDALKHVPHLKELTMSFAEWECHDLTGQATYAREVLTCVAQRLPKLEQLDLRTKSYDLIDGTLSWKCVDADRLCLNDFASVIPLFPNLRVLRLPLRSRKGDATETSAEIARLSPKLEVISWMQCIGFEGKLDEYTITRSADLPTSVVRLTPPPPSRHAGTAPVVSREGRHGLSLFDTLFSSFVNPSKPSIFSDIAVTFSVLMVVGSTLLSPFYVIFG